MNPRITIFFGQKHENTNNKIDKYKPIHETPTFCITCFYMFLNMLIKVISVSNLKNKPLSISKKY